MPYRTVAGPGDAEFTVQGSRFIGYVTPVASVDDADAFVAEVAGAHPDATHNVPAYRVRAGTEFEGRGETMLREYSSDDGEPTGSAGKPALSVLAKRDLENVAVVVTRYYGGTNLGVGGLVRAYSRAVNDAVDAAGVIEEVPHRGIAITSTYDDSGTVRGILESEGVEFDAAYEAAVSFDVRVPVADADTLVERITSATSGRVEVSRSTNDRVDVE